MINTQQLFDPEHSLAAGYVFRFTYPWEALAGLADFIRQLGHSLPSHRFEKRGEDIWIARSATVAPTSSITGPCIIDEEADIRHCAFIRGSAVVGKGAVVGNSTELKNVILFDGVQVPHYNYVGDSILGYKAHMGAGAITSNVKSDKSSVIIRYGDQRWDTGRKKCGAMVGDCAEIGCNTVLNPGTIVCRDATVYPVNCVGGVVPARHIYKNAQTIVMKRSE